MELTQFISCSVKHGSQVAVYEAEYVLVMIPESLGKWHFNH